MLSASAFGKMEDAQSQDEDGALSRIIVLNVTEGLFIIKHASRNGIGVLGVPVEDPAPENRLVL